MAEELSDIREADKVEIYERVLKAIARQPQDIMYEGPEDHPMFQAKDRSFWAQNALSFAGVTPDEYDRRNPYTE